MPLIYSLTTIVFYIHANIDMLAAKELHWTVSHMMTCATGELSPHTQA